MKMFNTPIIVGLVILVVLIILCSGRSMYRLSPMPVEIKPVTEASIFDLPYKLECVPGPEKTASAYTKALTPGGICGAQKLVRDHAEYKMM